MLSVNGRNSGLVTCRSVTCRPGIGWGQIVRWQTGQGWIARWSRTDRMMMIDQGWTEACKGRYNGECAKVDTITVRETAYGEECSKQLILGSGFKTADLVRESKRRTGLLVRLIANECYEDTFYFLSFLPTVLRLPSLASHTCLISLHRIICGII